MTEPRPLDPLPMGTFSTRRQATAGEETASNKTNSRTDEADEAMEAPTVVIGTTTPRTIPVLLDAVAARYGQSLALSAGNVEVTFQELNARANQIAGFLLKSGNAAESKIPIFGRLSLEMLEIMLGILKAGAMCVLPDGPIPEQTISDAVLKLAPQLIFAENDDPKLLPLAWRSRKLINYPKLRRAITALSPEIPSNSAAATNSAFCYVGCDALTIQHHQATVDRLQALEEALPLADRPTVVCKTDDLFSGSLCILLWLLRGASVVLIPGEDNDPASWVRLIQTKKASVACIPTRDLSRFCECMTAAEQSFPESLCYVLGDGEAPSPHLLGKNLSFPFEVFLVQYLPEVGGPFLVSPWQSTGKNEVVFSSHSLGMDVYILDQFLRPLPHGIDGEIFVSGDCTARGYMCDPARTAQYFIPDPFSGVAGNRLFRTETGARWLADSTIELRRSSQRRVWLKNRYVSLPHIEKTILEEYRFDDCYVISRFLSQGASALVCFIASAEPFYSDEISRRLGSRLPPAMIPDFYVPIAKLPLLPSGEVDEQQLLAIEVLHPGLCDEWKRQLEERECAELFSVVEEPFEETNVPIHLSDLIPDWKTSSRLLPGGISAPANLDNVRPEATPAQQPESFGDALVSGGPLVIDDAHPLTLQEGFLRAGSRDDGIGVTYIGANGAADHHSYAQIYVNAKRILGGLSQLGLQAGTSVILQIDKMQEYIPAFWACILGGIRPVTVAIPAAYEEENAVVRKLASTFDQLGHPPILAGDSVSEQVGKALRNMHLADVKVIGVCDVREHAPQEKFPELVPEDVAFFQLTSGSTGVSKVIQETHGGVVTHVHATMQFNRDRVDDVTLNWLPMDHVGPLLMCLCKDSYLGRKQVQVPTDLIISRPLLWLDLIERYKVAFTWAPNFAYKLVVHALKQGLPKTWNLASLRYFFNAGEQVTAPVVEEFLDLVAPFGVAQSVMQPAYGMAETGTAITYLNNFSVQRGIRHFEKRSFPDTLKDAAIADSSTVTFVGVGSPIPGVQLRIVDGRDRVVRQRRIGRLQVQGNVVTPGYFNNPKANAEAFTKDGWFNTGDLGFLWDRDLTITGREKEIIIINGANYHCHEIEDVVSQIKGVEPTWVACCGVSGDETETLVVFFCPTSQSFEGQVSIIPEISRKVGAGIGITPGQVIPISKEVFPKTTSGKIQRSQLRDAFIRGDYDPLLKEIDMHLRNTNTIPDWFYRKIWRRKQGRLLRANTRSMRCAVFLRRGDQLGEQLVDCLEAEGAVCIRVEAANSYTPCSPLSYRIDPTKSDDYRHLFDKMAENCLLVDKILYLWACDSFATQEEPSIHSRDEHDLLRLFQALDPRRGVSENLDLYAVTRNSQFASSRDTVDWERASISGLLKSLSLELPWVRVCHLDLGSAEENVPSRIFRELHHASHDTEVAYRKGYRLVPRLQKTKLRKQDEGAPPIKSDGFYLVTGGLGAIGSRLAQNLVEHWNCKVLLIGRRELPPRPAENDLDRERDETDIFWNLLGQGKQVSYRVADVTDPDAVEKAVRETMPGNVALDGVFHLAGTYREGKLAELTDASYSAVTRAKTTGTRVLYELLKGRPEAIFVCFSSLNGFFGGLGLSDYAAASSFVDTFCAAHAEQHGPKVYGFSWHFWHDLGMSRNLELRKFAATRNDEGITFSQGMYSLLAGLGGPPGHLFVGINASKPHLRRRLEDRAYSNVQLNAYYTEKRSRLGTRDVKSINVPDPFGTPTTCHLLSASRTGIDGGRLDRAFLKRGLRSGADPHAAASTPLERQVASLWQDVLKVPWVGTRDNFFELGGHSLLAVKMIGRIKESFGLDFTMSDLFAASTVSDMADRIEAMRLNMAPRGDITNTARSGVERGEI